MEEELLGGGVANAGSVVRQGRHVLRPSNPHSESIHRALSGLRSEGFDGVPKVVGVDDDGRERLEFIDGDVPVPPYPEWARSDDALVSVTVLIRRLHDASAGVDLSAGTWSTEMADPLGGSVLCHNDVCLENVVFGEGRAVALLDFDFAAPGRRVFDLASFARMCVPVDDDLSASRLGWTSDDRPARLRLVADSYGLGPDDRVALLRIVGESIELGGEFVRRRVEAGEPGFVKMWEEMGGQQRYDRRRSWWAENRAAFAAAL